MTFTPEQKEALAGPLNSAFVKPPAPGKYGEYIEGWRAIDEANRIFGFEGWTRETVQMVETCRELLSLSGKNGPYQQWRVGYMAKARVTAGGVVREGTGFGSGMAKPEALADAIESAVKEAETDAMKRALMTFGNPFGLALYDKTKANVADVESPANDTPRDEPAPREKLEGKHSSKTALGTALRAYGLKISNADSVREIDAILEEYADDLAQARVYLPKWMDGDPSKDSKGLVRLTEERRALLELIDQMRLNQTGKALAAWFGQYETEIERLDDGARREFDGAYEQHELSLKTVATVNAG